MEKAELTIDEMRQTLIAFEKRAFECRKMSAYELDKRTRDWNRMEESKVKKWYNKFFITVFKNNSNEKSTTET